MKVVITGGLGFLGQRLARRLLELERAHVRRGASGDDGAGGTGGDSPGRALRGWTPASSSPPATWPTPAAGSGIDRDDVSVFHLAAVVSAEAERDPELAWRVNVNRKRRRPRGGPGGGGGRRRHTTYAVFGGALPDVYRDDTKTPTCNKSDHEGHPQASHSHGLLPTRRCSMGGWPSCRLLASAAGGGARPSRARSSVSRWRGVPTRSGPPSGPGRVHGRPRGGGGGRDREARGWSQR